MYGILLDRVAVAITAAFPDAYVYGDSIRQDFQGPAFFIATEEVACGQELGERFFADYHMKISHYGIWDCTAKTPLLRRLHETALSLLGVLYELPGGERPLYGKDAHYRIGGEDVLEFFITYRLYGHWTATAAGGETMKKIRISEGVR